RESRAKTSIAHACRWRLAARIIEFWPAALSSKDKATVTSCVSNRPAAPLIEAWVSRKLPTPADNSSVGVTPAVRFVLYVSESEKTELGPIDTRSGVLPDKSWSLM